MTTSCPVVITTLIEVPAPSRWCLLGACRGGSLLPTPALGCAVWTDGLGAPHNQSTPCWGSLRCWDTHTTAGMLRGSLHHCLQMPARGNCFQPEVLFNLAERWNRELNSGKLLQGAGDAPPQSIFVRLAPCQRLSLVLMVSGCSQRPPQDHSRTIASSSRPLAPAVLGTISSTFEGKCSPETGAVAAVPAHNDIKQANMLDKYFCALFQR